MVTGSFQEQLEAYYQWFHQHPEPSYEELETTAHLRDVLTEFGIDILDTGLNTGLVACIKGTDTRGGGDDLAHVVALRGDIDALPIQEDTGLPYPSLNAGYLHGCGHDYNLTTVLGSALLLNDRREELPGVVKIVFQPAEEVAATKATPTGAVTVLKTGALDDVEVFYGVHDANQAEPGTFLIGPGSTSGAVDKFRIEVTGRGAHAAHPNAGLNPIRPIAALINAVESVIGQDLDPTHPAVATVTHVEAGNTWNVIASSGFFEGTVRTAFPEDREILRNRLQSLADGVAASFGVQVRFIWEYGSPAVVNDPKWSALAAATAEQLGLSVLLPRPTLGGEDFSYYLQRAPGAFVNIGVGNGHLAMHGPNFYPQLDALADGASLMAAVVENTLQELGA